MKLTTTYALIAIIWATCTSFQNAGTKVYICISAKAYAYHYSLNCRGIKQCTHEVKEISIKEALKLGKKACGYER